VRGRKKKRKKPSGEKREKGQQPLAASIPSPSSLVGRKGKKEEKGREKKKEGRGRRGGRGGRGQDLVSSYHW